LGCTHYPYLIPQIRKIIGPKIHIIDSGQAVAKQTKKVLSEAGLLKTIQTKNKRSHQFLINRDKNTLTELLADCEKEKSLILLETDF
jgi:glutamate racemase